MNSFELIDEDLYAQIFVSKKHDLRIVKTNSRANVFVESTGELKCEFINAEDKFISDKIKEMIREV